MSSTTTINIQNTQTEVDHVHVGLSVGGGGGRKHHIFIGSKMASYSHVIYMGRNETINAPIPLNAQLCMLV